MPSVLNELAKHTTFGSASVTNHLKIARAHSGGRRHKSTLRIMLDI